MIAISHESLILKDERVKVHIFVKEDSGFAGSFFLKDWSVLYLRPDCPLGYNGFLPLNTRNPYCARVESGANLRTNDKSHITDQHLGKSWLPWNAAIWEIK